MNSPAFVGRATLFLTVLALIAMPAKADDSSLPTLRPTAPLNADELAQLLGANIWKFAVVLPADATHVEVTLSIKEKGHEALGFGTGVSGAIDANSKRELLIAIIPLSGTLNDADKVRVVVSGLGVFAAGIKDNPLKKLGIGRPEIPEDNKDGTFNLIGGYAGSHVSSPVSSADKVISLKIDAKK